MNLRGLPALLLPDVAAVGGGFLILFGVAAATAFLLGGTEAAAAVEQPLSFNHRVHVEGEGLECAMCHQRYSSETWSGMPSTATCALCHEEAQGESAAEAELVRMIEEGAPIEWAPLFRQPPHVFFSHRRHVAVAGLECATCHGDIGSSEAPPTFAAPLSMDACIVCHAEQGVSEHCSACHR